MNGCYGSAFHSEAAPPWQQTNPITREPAQTLTVVTGIPRQRRQDKSIRIGQSSFEYLDAPVRRVAAEDTFVPRAPNLEALVLPPAAGLRHAAEDLLRW